MRPTLIILLILLSLGAVSWAQTSSSPEASPAAVASQSGRITQAPYPPGVAYPPWLGARPQHRRSVRIVFIFLRVVLSLSAIFALTALGIFLLRRSRPGP